VEILFNRPREQTSDVNQRYYIICRAGFSFALVQHILFVWLFTHLSVPILPYYNIVSILLFVIALFYNEQRKFHIAMTLAFAEIVIHQTLATILLGFDSGFQAYILFCIMLPMLSSQGHTLWKWFVAGTSFATLLILVLFFRTHEPIVHLSDTIINTMAVVNEISVILILIVIASLFNNTTLRYEEKIAQENLYAHSLLLNILPEPITQRIGSEKLIADRYQETSVLFADIVDFTPFSESISPNQLVSILHDLFVRFDELTDTHGCEKIKTIGDAYMVAAGVPELAENHADRLVECGFSLLEAVESFQIRIGIHSGPVVAGVIGSKKFSYDLWGDTVNTASRMESNGVSGKIQITASVKERLNGSFQFVSRGIIAIKGKGSLETFIVERA